MPKLKVNPDRAVEAFSQVLRVRRKGLLLTQEQLAERTGLHRTYIADCERGLRNPSLITVCRLARGLEVSGTDLLREAESIMVRQ